MEKPTHEPKVEHSEPERDALLAALQQNWDHARHEENMRLGYFTFYWFALASALAFAVENDKNGAVVHPSKTGQPTWV